MYIYLRLFDGTVIIHAPTSYANRERPCGGGPGGRGALREGLGAYVTFVELATAWELTSNSTNV